VSVTRRLIVRDNPDALEELPADVDVSLVEVTQLQTGDVVVLSLPNEKPTPEQLEHIRRDMRKLFPNNATMVCCNGASLQVVRP